MAPTPEPHEVGKHRLGQHVVGQRVVIRRLVSGERGPSGGPAFSDLLGECLSWGSDAATLRLADGTVVSVPLTEIVSGKPVPPRPSVRHRISPRDAQLIALDMWRQLDTAPVGDWLLRWSATSQARRANSVLAMGPAGRDDAVARVVEHYRGLGRRPIASVLPGSAEEAELHSLGWVSESGDADSLFQIAGVAAARRGAADRPAYAVTLEESGSHVIARVGDAAQGHAALGHDWVGVRALEVAPERRRRGVGLALVAALLDWGAERGATTAYLQVLADNEPALSLYARLGFATHHAYRYLALPARTGTLAPSAGEA